MHAVPTCGHNGPPSAPRWHVANMNGAAPIVLNRPRPIIRTTRGHKPHCKRNLVAISIS
jgi:hypothetical protein